jgi:hypothetical protein
VFGPGKTFQHGPFVAEGGVPTGAELSDNLALPTNIRLGWKGLPRTNTLAYLGLFINDEVQRNIILTATD